MNREAVNDTGDRMVRKIALDKSEIVSGRPLPFSVFDPHRNLLLAAKGQIVTDWMREALLRNGLMALADEADDTSQAAEAATDDTPSPLHQLRMQYSRMPAGSRWGFRISRDERSDSYACRVIGVGERRGLIMTAPAKDDRSYVAIGEGQTWLFRTFYATAAIRFSGVIEKVLFNPFPYFHVEVPAQVEMRHIRKGQRVAVCLAATLQLETPTDAIIVDVSSTGLRIGVDASVALQESQQLQMTFRITVLDKCHELTAQATVARALAAADPLHPQIHFYGLGLEPQNDFDRLLLHAFVQGCVAQELDGLSKMLAG